MGSVSPRRSWQPRACARLNPDVQVQVYALRLTAENAAEAARSLGSGHRLQR